ncbi:hypothetical protein AB7M17_005266 [Bradyrhizobium sp. USDA 377]
MLDPDRISNPELDALALAIDRKQVSAINYDDFLRRDFPPRENLLAPWLPKAGLAMVHAPRGIGKTHFGHNVAWAVAAGGAFLRWTTPSGALRVLLLDGEMPGALLQQRLRKVIEASGLEPPMPDYLRIAAADLRRDPNQEKDE